MWQNYADFLPQCIELYGTLYLYHKALWMWPCFCLSNQNYLISPWKKLKRVSLPNHWINGQQSKKLDHFTTERQHLLDRMRPCFCFVPSKPLFSLPWKSKYEEWPWNYKTKTNNGNESCKQGKKYFKRLLSNFSGTFY